MKSCVLSDDLAILVIYAVPIWLGVLVCAGCYNKTPQTGWLINSTLFLTVLDTGESKIKVTTDSVSGGLCPGSQMTISSLYPHMAEKPSQEALWGLFHKDNNPIC